MADDLTEDGDGEKDLFSILEHDEEAEEEQKQKLIEEEEQEVKDEPPREIIKDNDVPLNGKSSVCIVYACNDYFTSVCCCIYTAIENVVTSCHTIACNCIVQSIVWS